MEKEIGGWGEKKLIDNKKSNFAKWRIQLSNYKPILPTFGSLCNHVIRFSYAKHKL